jgi:hypothetical protein
MKAIDIVTGTGNVIDDHIELQIVDESEFSGVTFYYDGMRFADKENKDGSINMTFDYQVTGGHIIQEVMKHKFEKKIGDLIITILEEQIEKGEVIYSGGVDE